MSRSKYINFTQNGFKVVESKTNYPNHIMYRVVNEERQIEMWLCGATMKKVYDNKTNFERVYYFRSIGGRKQCLKK